MKSLRVRKNYRIKKKSSHKHKKHSYIEYLAFLHSLYKHYEHCAGFDIMGGDLELDA